MSNSEVLLALHRALERGDAGDVLRPLFTDDVIVREHPNAIRPKGGTDDLEGVIAGSAAGAALLAEQHYGVRELVEHGDEVTARLTWTATVAKDAGPFRSGDVLTAHVAQFARIRDGRIASLETFDCYEPLPQH